MNKVRAQAVDHIKEHGYFIMRKALDEALCDDILAEIRRLDDLKIPRSLDNNFHGHLTTRYYDVLNYGDVWQRVATHKSILPIVRDILGEDCLLNTFGTSIIGPGETAQSIHVDDGPFIAARNSSLRHRPHLYEGGPRQSIVLNTMIALCDFTEEIGATRLVPDSNKMPYPRPQDSDAWMAKSIPALMNKGDVLFFEGQCYHAGGANRTTQKRFAVTVDYCAGYLRTQENFMLSIGQNKAAHFDDDLKQLIGYRISKGGLGHVYNHEPQGLMKLVAI
ncbi:MAG: phytanoyl-CoA dioxygenase family protein [Pseudomonadales bacterium]|nr:phytanoyl-CoA dioxygenase family protein [Pseudomonadales bacterium]